MTIKALSDTGFISTSDIVSKTIDVDIEVKELKHMELNECLQGYVDNNEEGNLDSLRLSLSSWKFIGADVINGILEFRVTYEIDSI